MEQTQNTSKREQKKLDQALKIIRAMQSQEGKECDEGHYEPKPRKKRKTSSKVCPIGVSVKSEEAQNAIQTKSASHLTPQYDKSEPIKDKLNEQLAEVTEEKSNLNPLFPLGDGQVSSYLICYQYQEQQRQMDKETTDFSVLDDLGEPLKTTINSLQLVSTFNKVLSQSKGTLKSAPLGKQHQRFKLKWRGLS